MRIIKVGQEGLVRIDPYQQPADTVKEPGELWIAVTPDEIPLLAEGAEAVEAKTQKQLRGFHDDLKKHGVDQADAPADQTKYLEDRAERAATLLSGLRQLSENPQLIERYSRRVGR